MPAPSVVFFGYAPPGAADVKAHFGRVCPERGKQDQHRGLPAVIFPSGTVLLGPTRVLRAYNMEWQSWTRWRKTTRPRMIVARFLMHPSHSRSVKLRPFSATPLADHSSHRRQLCPQQSERRGAVAPTPPKPSALG